MKNKRKERAEARKATRSTLTPTQQLNILDDRLGQGVGATRERARLTAAIKP